MEVFMTVNGLMTNHMVKEDQYMKMDLNMKDNFLKINVFIINIFNFILMLI